MLALAVALTIAPLAASSAETPDGTISNAATDIAGVSSQQGSSSTTYLKKTESGWVSLTRDAVEISAVSAAAPPQITASFTNSGIFLPYQAYPTGSWPEAVAIGDVNNDGRNDVVMTTSFYFDPANDYHIHVFLQNAYGGLDAPVKYLTSGSSLNRPDSIAIGDVNNDGRADVIVGNQGKNIEVFLQNASGALDPGITYATVDSYSLKLGDLNNDGLLDIASTGWSTNTVNVFLQNSSGAFDAPATYYVTHSGYEEIDVGDVNNDGLQDIVVMNGQGSSPNLGVLLQNPAGGFYPATYYDLGGNELTSGVAVGDVNGDNLKDIVVTYGGNSPNAYIGEFLQNGSGRLNLPVSYAAYDVPETVEIADVNFDGKNDVIVLDGGWYALSVYLQSPNGAPAPYETYVLPYASHYNRQGMAIGDINGDGGNDVVIADYNSGLVVLYNSTLPPRPDVKANGVDAAVTVRKGSPLNVTISLDPGRHAGEPADWWLEARTPFGSFWLNQNYKWVKSTAPVRLHGGPIFKLTSFTVLSSTALPKGNYFFYFSLDDNMDGAMDGTYQDNVSVIVN